MEKKHYGRRNFIVLSISVLTIGGMIALSQYDAETTPREIINIETSNLSIVHCWQSIPSSTRIRCKYALNQCGPTWTEGYPPPSTGAAGTGGGKP